MNFKAMQQTDVPRDATASTRSRVENPSTSIRFPRASLLKAALGTAREQGEGPGGAEPRDPEGGRHVATASDETFLYVWNETL